jgi:dynein light chain LC8-type|uniref:Dynein light chain n=1 Tax=Eutreptiella gymnastica TaxID=73025 RepID=A0A7S4LN31_9EUGL|mmetsp:Transcript_79343/g.132876  ORF Transcript_79343/g.132876 Transcript_79343/m.132876 type:complete len:111 (+) Transcript_79343:150-482(+)|eukprot:CAMPEP_0174291550 /NCGR_PEP_ID=MMETSP0809-20121228/32456_1 /TAXON_ID=73025 ORGANISM="Eutreptiella gymnastica-like, Strain CCMP1594" /NCGR_SAMPLE_ID=MMETSP0809 /ASSEMBLY_ACC=CAM_ASM_000658 /LENGTH=110 /DNA_ID=CAMNT_0015390957 /DNA_START=151 /DNA_END=483 /DNA_ORIENTATION=-
MASAVDKKEKEGENVTVTDRKATVIKSEMSEEMTANATRWCNQALDKCKEGTPNQEREIAKHVKEQFDKQYGATWHCGFGSNFGAHVTYEEGRFLLFNVGQYNLILWKHM